MDHSAGLTGKTSLEKKNIVSAKKQLLLKKQKNSTIRKVQVYIYMYLLINIFTKSVCIIFIYIYIYLF